jgi:very-short-patch-repair endonuclease
MLNYNKRLKPLAQKLRKNMTDAEKLLWSRVRMKQISGFQFYRQPIIGDYIVDLYCPAAKLVVEIDAGQHYYGEGQESDKTRDNKLSILGLKILRFSNLEVLQNIDSVLEQIYLNTKSP